MTTATRHKIKVVSCRKDSLRVMDCLTATECFSNRIVRLQCREPAFLGCYKDNQLNFQTEFNTGFGVDSESECMSTCRRQPESNGVAVMHEGLCICFQSKTYAQIISGGNFSHNWTCPLATEFDSDRHHSFNLSVGFCDHPEIVPNGSWDSDITSFGSKITLTCDEGYTVNGSAILQCVGLPGWSTYFPVWNASVPSCRAVESKNKDAAWQDGNITTMPTQSIESTAQDPESQENDYITFILGTFLVVFAVVGILSIAWCRHQQKRHPEASGQSNVNSREEQSQLNPLNTSTQGSTDGVVSLHSTSIDTYSAGRILPQHPGNKSGGAIGHRENTYQNSAEGHTSSSTDRSRETRQRSGRGSAYTRSCPHDVIHQGGKHECNNEAADNTKVLYMDMSGSEKKGKKKVIFLQSRHFNKEEEDIDEDGYLLSNVSLHRATRFHPEASVSPCGKEISIASSIQSRGVDDASQCGKCQSSIYHEIPSASEQSAPIPEPQYCPTYWNIEGNAEFGPYAMTRNDHLYAVSIYPSMSRVEHEVDEHGYLVLETDPGESVIDGCESHNSLSSTKIDLYENEISHQDHFNSTVYESIPREPEL
ncbi:uncharacterized protein [Diadema setosum]|uniref:uncharacterized protein n=1 Tax=Diadema setosum TaxID=31175 RepID=UPI003B3AC284